ncbi:hypothetical protein LOAG_15098 [Loa loa]|uniref:Uncharacterized protein n=1 Tax=Loa loa TaxID=7209 RepID=A0A1S0TGZ5_LOALO|nr:hypothetical protein LOAG_15098 [Loa loa]EFO13431.1 hypothetical protein LOAG_15098 [Loa loa]
MAERCQQETSDKHQTRFRTQQSRDYNRFAFRYNPADDYSLSRQCSYRYVMGKSKSWNYSGYVMGKSKSRNYSGYVMGKSKSRNDYPGFVMDKSKSPYCLINENC